VCSSDLNLIDFHINTSTVDFEDAYFWEDFEKNWPTSEGNTTPDPYDDTYDYEATDVAGALNLSAGFNASYDPEETANNTVWWINNTGVGDEVTQWFNESRSDLQSIYEIGFDFNVTTFNDGVMEVMIGYPYQQNASLTFQTSPNGYDYIILGNDNGTESKNLSEFPLTGPNVWYTARFYIDWYNMTINCTIWDTATVTELYDFDLLDLGVDTEPQFFYGDLHFIARDDDDYGNTSIKIDNYYVMGYDSALNSNAFKVVPIGADILLVLDNVDNVSFDATVWADGTPYTVYTGLLVETWYHYFFEFNWDNDTIETTVRNSTDNAWLGSNWTNMSGDAITGVLFSGIDTFDCENWVDNVTIDYTVLDSTGSEIRDYVREAVIGGMTGLAAIGNLLPIIMLAIVITLVIGLILGLSYFGNKKGPGSNESGAL
jgi:hypothetical protein